jgi:hypothetical protein
MFFNSIKQKLLIFSPTFGVQSRIGSVFDEVLTHFEILSIFFFITKNDIMFASSKDVLLDSGCISKVFCNHVFVKLITHV